MRDELKREAEARYESEFSDFNRSLARERMLPRYDFLAFGTMYAIPDERQVPPAPAPQTKPVAK